MTQGWAGVVLRYDLFFITISFNRNNFYVFSNNQNSFEGFIGFKIKRENKMTRSNKKPKTIQRYFAGADLVLRWQICQNIGKCYYHSKLSENQLEGLVDYLRNEENLPKADPIINIK